MLEEAHRALLVSRDRAGEEVEGAEDHVSEEVATRAWTCSCGWRGELRRVDDRFFRPAGDVEDRLRSGRVRRSDRAARAAWDVHVAALDAVSARAADGSDPVGAPSAATAEEAGEAGERGTVEQEPPTIVPLVRSARAERARLRQLCPDEVPLRVARTPHSEPSPVGADAVDGSTSSLGAAPPTGPLGRAAEQIARVAAQVSVARAELVDAEAALNAAVRGARVQGLSWRAIAAAAGVDHRSARARWTLDTPPDTAP